MQPPLHHNEPDRRTRLLAALALALLGLIGLVRLWPAATPDVPRTLPTSTTDMVTIEEIVATSQTAQSAPPPPPDLPPVEVADEVELEEVPLNLDVALAPGPPTPAPPTPDPPGEDATTTRSSGGETRNPAPVRMVQPTYTDEAQRRRVRAEVRVEVTVNESGRVVEAQIRERFLIGRGGERTAVATLEYGLEEAALEAARRWMFRPALLNGKKVSSTFPLTLRWGTGG